MLDTARAQVVFRRIEKDEVCRLAIELASIDSPTGREMAAGCGSSLPCRTRWWCARS